MWLIVRAVVVVPGVRVLGATFDDGKELASKSGSSGSVVVEGTGLRLLKLTISGTDCSPLDHSLAEMVDCQSWGPASPCWQWCSSCSAEGRGWKQPKPRRHGNGGVVALIACNRLLLFKPIHYVPHPLLFPLTTAIQQPWRRPPDGSHSLIDRSIDRTIGYGDFYDAPLPS